MLFITFLFTGKSSVTIQFVENHFVDSYDPTIENSMYEIQEQIQLEVLLCIDSNIIFCPQKTFLMHHMKTWHCIKYQREIFKVWLIGSIINKLNFFLKVFSLLFFFCWTLLVMMLSHFFSKKHFFHKAFQKTLKIRGQEYSLQVIDTAGQVLNW